jgi:flagellar biosynthesis protein FlhB
MNHLTFLSDSKSYFGDTKEKKRNEDRHSVKREAKNESGGPVVENRFRSTQD